MAKTTPKVTPLWVASLGIVGASLAFSVPTNAQDSEQSIEEVVVTGSRIARDEFTSSSPISVFDVTDITKAGNASLDEFLKDVPAFTGFQLGTSTNNGGDGTKKIDMRGLEFKRTLVLINGRRQISDMTTADGGVDIGTIPKAMVKSVEILKDGASTVYGSDALAGVVNFILHDDFEGIEFNGDWGDGSNDYGFSFLAGLNGERGNMMMSLGYSTQKELLQGDRDWAQDALYPQFDAVNDRFVATASGSSNSRRIRTLNDGNWIVDNTSGVARPFEAGDVYNYAPVNALLTPNETWQFGAIGTVTVTEQAEGYFEALYTRRTSHQRLAPDASFAVNSSFETPNNGPQWNDYVPANNPFNPFGINPNNSGGISGEPVRINRRFVESGGRIFVQSSDTYRMVAGIRGDLGSSMNWDVSYTFAENEVVDETQNYGRFDRWAIAVDPVACAADADCTAAGGVLNPFGPFGSITADQMAYLSTGSLKDQKYGRMNMFAASLGGEMFELSGGTAGWAVGYEKRYERGFFKPDEFSAGGLTTGGASDPLEGAFSVGELYAEVYLPVLDNLNIDVSTRFSDYDNSAGSSTTYKIGLDYAVNEMVRIRSGYSTGFRAPNIPELNREDDTGFPIVEPICEFADRRLAAGAMTQTAYDNCIAMGVDPTDAGEYGFAWQSAYTTASTGDLEPEESTTFTIGAVVTPLEGLSFSIDYWDIEIENVIDTDDFNDLMSACINSVGLSAPACAAFTGGVPFDGVFPSDANGIFGNLGVLTTTGWDLEALYNGHLDSNVINGYRVSWSATLQTSYERDYPLAGSRELSGTANGFAVFPELRYNLGGGVYGDNWSVDLTMQFIDETKDALRPAALTDDAVAEDIYYFDLAGGYTWNNVDFTLGVNNLTDEDPPRFHSAFNANTEPGMYDVYGRRFFASAKVKF